MLKLKTSNKQSIKCHLQHFSSAQLISQTGFTSHGHLHYYWQMIHQDVLLVPEIITTTNYNHIPKTYTI